MFTPLGFTILYEQGGCLVVNKPPGVLTQAPPGIDSLEVRIKTYLGYLPEGQPRAARGAEPPQERHP